MEENTFRFIDLQKSEVAIRGVLSEKVFLEISKNSQQNTCVLELRPATLLKKKLWHRCFPMNFVKFRRTRFFTERLRLLLMKFIVLLVIASKIVNKQTNKFTQTKA